MAKVKEKQSAAESGKRVDCLLDDALTALKEHAKAKFVEKVDIGLQTGIDARKMMVRGMAKLPNGTGKAVKVAVFRIWRSGKTC